MNKLNILLVEPDRVLGSIYVSALENAGYCVVHCLTADAAVNALDAARVDLVILELQIALHNGVEFLYEMRSYDEWRHIPIILHTTIEERVLQKMLDLKKQLFVSTYLYKPTTTLNQLLDTVSSISLQTHV